MAIRSDDGQVPSVRVAECQAELHDVLETLRRLGEITEMESWSYSIGVQYRMILDDLAALDAYLELFKLSSNIKVQGDGRTLDGLSPNP